MQRGTKETQAAFLPAATEAWRSPLSPQEVASLLNSQDDMPLALGEPAAGTGRSAEDRQMDCVFLCTEVW